MKRMITLAIAIAAIITSASSTNVMDLKNKKAILVENYDAVFSNSYLIPICEEDSAVVDTNARTVTIGDMKLGCDYSVESSGMVSHVVIVCNKVGGIEYLTTTNISNVSGKKVNVKKIIKNSDK